VLSKLLFPKWTFEDGEEDLTVMRVIVEGQLDRLPTRLTWELFDHFDPQTGFSSMSRTTAYPCTSVTRMILDGTIDAVGVHPPERLADVNGVQERILKDLRARNIDFRADVEQQARPTSNGKRRKRGAKS
jgi:saccharopine dehydrogenase-like NADP-dependent oxidoreductase